MHALTRLFALGLCAAVTASAVQAQGRGLGHVPNVRPSASSQAAQAAPRPGGLAPVFPAGLNSGSGTAVANDPIARSTSPMLSGTARPGSGTGTGTDNGTGTGTGTGGNTGNGTDPGSGTGSNTGNGTGSGTGSGNATGNGNANGGSTGNAGGNGTGGPNGGVPTANVVTNVMGAAGPTVRGPAQDLAGAGGFSAHDQARSFFFADANKDGELTRAEAARLSIVTLPFEEMDRNFDGVITRFEYEDSLR